MLGEDRDFPLCAPDPASGLPDQHDQMRLDAAPLLHDESLNDCPSWFSQVGAARTEFASGFNFSDTGQTPRAAIPGHGVCLATALQADQPLKDRRIVHVGKAALARTGPLHMLCWKRNFTHPPVMALWDWLQRQFPSGMPKPS